MLLAVICVTVCHSSWLGSWFRVLSKSYFPVENSYRLWAPCSFQTSSVTIDVVANFSFAVNFCVSHITLISPCLIFTQSTPSPCEFLHQFCALRSSQTSSFINEREIDFSSATNCCVSHITLFSPLSNFYPMSACILPFPPCLIKI